MLRATPQGIQYVVNVVLYLGLCLILGQATGMEPCGLIITENTYDRSTGSPKLWPSTRIPYTVASNLQPEHHKEFNDALDQFHTRTCLRFEPKSADDKDHIHINMKDIPPYCGLAHLCLQGIGAQQIDISPVCNFAGNYIHEMGHALCMEHEHTRPDRNKYLDYSECSNPSDMYPDRDTLPNRIQIYDYNSVEHYGCGGCLGIPSKKERKNCGTPGIGRSTKALTAIDADKINQLYGCQGCHGHRWYRVDTMTPEEEANVVNFGTTEDGNPAYLCRGLFEGVGTIATGLYDSANRACLIFASYRESFVVSGDIQLFALPNGQTSITEMTSKYHLLDPEDKSIDPFVVPVGRDNINYDVAAAVAEIEQDDGTKITLLGWTLLNSRNRGAYFVHKNERVHILYWQTNAPKYFVIGCSE